jgi:hypothetical protein
MNILDALKKKHMKQKGHRMLNFGDKKQYNVTIHPRIIQKVRKLSAEYAVPQYAIAEHVMETGCFYAFKILESRKKREVLREHIIDQHMLNSGYDDPEEIVRLGEGRYAADLLSMARVVVRDFRVLKREVSEANRRKIISGIEEHRRQLLHSVVNLAEWLASHPIEEPDNSEMAE